MSDRQQPGVGLRRAEATGAAVESPGASDVDPHDGGPFTGMRFMLIPASSGQEELERRIVGMGGQVLSPFDFRSCTHVCVEGDALLENLRDALRREGKEPVSHGWVNEQFESNKFLLDDDVPAARQRDADDDGMSEETLSTSKRSRSELESESSGSMGRSDRRKHSYYVDDDVDDEEEMIHHRHHDLFLCKLDRSPKISLHDYAAQMQSRLQVLVPVPGSLEGQISISTEPDVILVVRKSYKLLRCLHEAGLTLAGQFNSKNVLIGEALFSKNIQFGHLPRGALKQHSPDDEELDLARFKTMIRQEVFVECIAPHDLSVWLTLIGKKGFEELLLDHISLMEAYQSASTFMSLCYDFQEMEHTDPDKQEAIISELSRYSDWKRRVSSMEGNTYLQEILGYIDPATDKVEDYEDDLRGLLRLVMNYYKRGETWRTVALIVGHDFPNLMSDFQKMMYKVGYYVPEPRWE